MNNTNGSYGGDLSKPVNVLTLISLPINIIFLLMVAFGQLFYGLYGPIRGPGFPKKWAQPFLVSSIVLANILTQILYIVIQYQERIDTADADHSFSNKLLFASELIRNWSLVVFGVHAVLNRYKPTCLSGKIQFTLWVAMVVLIWTLSLIGSLASTDFSGKFAGIISYSIPLTCIGTFTAIVLPGYCFRKKLDNFFRCCRTSDPCGTTEADKWIREQRCITLWFYALYSLSYILVCQLDVTFLYIVFYLLFVLGAMALKDIRELAITFVCYVFCSCSARERDGKCQDEEKSNSGHEGDTKTDNLDKQGNILAIKNHVPDVQEIAKTTYNNKKCELSESADAGLEGQVIENGDMTAGSATVAIDLGTEETMKKLKEPVSQIRRKSRKMVKNAVKKHKKRKPDRKRAKDKRGDSSSESEEENESGETEGEDGDQSDNSDASMGSASASSRSLCSMPSFSMDDD